MASLAPDLSFLLLAAIVVGADQYLLFPAWQGIEREGYGSHCGCSSGVLGKAPNTLLPGLSWWDAQTADAAEMRLKEKKEL